MGSTRDLSSLLTWVPISIYTTFNMNVSMQPSSCSYELWRSYFLTCTRDKFEKELTKKYHFKATKDTEDLYYYEYSLGIYVKGGGWLIKQECLKFNPGINTSSVEQIQEHIIWGNYVDRSDFDRDIEWICCKNVMVNLKTGETAAHTVQILWQLSFVLCSYCLLDSWYSFPMKRIIICRSIFLYYPKIIMSILSIPCCV